MNIEISVVEKTVTISCDWREVERARTVEDREPLLRGLIERTPGVVGGRARISRTRIPVWTIEGYRRLGWSAEAILRSFPTLRPSDLEAAFEYAERHSAEIDRAIAENESA